MLSLAKGTSSFSSHPSSSIKHRKKSRTNSKRTFPQAPSNAQFYRDLFLFRLELYFDDDFDFSRLEDRLGEDERDLKKGKNPACHKRT